MSPTLLLLSGSIILLFTFIGLWLGRKISRAEGASAFAEEQKLVEEAKRAIQLELALARQTEGHLRGVSDEQKNEIDSLKTELDKLSEKHKDISSELSAALTQVEERSGQLKALTQERDDIRNLLTIENETVRKQGIDIGAATRLKVNFDELQETLKERGVELARLQGELAEAQGRIIELETTAKKDQEALATERLQLEESRNIFRQEFENLASQIFEKKHLTFDAQSKEGLNNLLAPFKEQLDSFRLRVDQVHTENVQGHTSLKGELDRLRELNQQITQEASNLTRALKGDKKIQGNWGEQKIELLLEQAGLRKGIEYSREQNFKDDVGNNLRPDFVVNLPEGKHIIIDSKVSLVDYAAYVAAETTEERQQFLAAHMAALRNHIKSLSEKKYPELLDMGSPDFTFLFIAIEPAYIAAAEHSPSLFQEAYDKRIALVTGTTLFPVLRVVANLWNLQRQNQSTQVLAEQASRVYDKLRIFIGKMEKLGNQIESVQGTYKDSFDTLKDGRGSLVKTVDKFVDLGVKVSKRLPSSMTGSSVPELAYGESNDEEILPLDKGN